MKPDIAQQQQMQSQLAGRLSNEKHQGNQDSSSNIPSTKGEMGGMNKAAVSDQSIGDLLQNGGVGVISEGKSIGDAIKIGGSLDFDIVAVAGHLVTKDMVENEISGGIKETLLAPAADVTGQFRSAGNIGTTGLSTTKSEGQAM